MSEPAPVMSPEDMLRRHSLFGPIVGCVCEACVIWRLDHPDRWMCAACGSPWEFQDAGPCTLCGGVEASRYESTHPTPS